MTRKAKTWRRLFYPQYEAKLRAQLAALGHDVYRVPRWQGRIAQLRERFRCAQCGQTAHVDYEQAQYGHLIGPALVVKCREVKHGV